MEKIYSKKHPSNNHLNPKIETINLILSYSKAFKVSVYNDLMFETILNQYTRYDYKYNFMGGLSFFAVCQIITIKYPYIFFFQQFW